MSLSDTLSPTSLAASSSLLNLSLMKWRLLPSLVFPKPKVLIFGAGTLGCSVSRSLVAWGVRDLTIVDNGKVSWSNPARQSLYQVTDCYNVNQGVGSGGKWKVEAACESLKRIVPDVVSKCRAKFPYHYTKFSQSHFVPSLN